MAEDLMAQSAAEGFEFDGQERHPRCMPCTVHFTALVVSQLTNTRAKVAMGALIGSSGPDKTVKSPNLSDQTKQYLSIV